MVINLSKVFFIDDLTGKFLIEFSNFFIESTRDLDFHIHHSLEISWVKQGTGVYYIDEKTYDIKKGDVFIISNTENHSLEHSGNITLINSVIHFEPQFLWSIATNEVDYQFLQIFFNRNENFSNRLDRDNPAAQKIYNLLEELEKEFTYQLPAYQLMVKIKLQTVIAEIVRNYNLNPTNMFKNKLTNKNINELQTVAKYIDTHLTENITLKDLSSLLYMSPTYFSSFFKRYNNLTPFEYIASKRIQRAVEYIVTTRKTFTEISTLCGFNNSTNFNKTFKKITGHTPTYYRQEISNG